MNEQTAIGRVMWEYLNVRIVENNENKTITIENTEAEDALGNKTWKPITLSDLTGSSVEKMLLRNFVDDIYKIEELYELVNELENKLDRENET